MLVVVGLSVLAAWLFAVAAIFQQRTARRVAERDPANIPAARRPAQVAHWLPGSALIGKLVREPVWVAGWVINTCGFVVQAVALHLGSTAVVQPLMVTQLLFTLLLATTGTRRRLAVQDWSGGLVISGGLAVLLAVRGAAPLTGHPDRPYLMLSTALCCGVAALLIAAAAGRSAVARATLLATAAGLFVSLSASLTKVTAFDLLHRGVGETARDWPGYALAATTALGMLLTQDAFATGPLPASMTALTVTNPIVGYLLGIFAFHGEAPTSPGELAAVASAGLLVTGGVAILSLSPNIGGTSPRRAGKDAIGVDNVSNSTAAEVNEPPPPCVDSVDGGYSPRQLGTGPDDVGWRYG